MPRVDLGRPVQSFRGSVRPFAKIGLGIGLFASLTLMVSLALRGGEASGARAAEALGVAALLTGLSVGLMAAFGMVMVRVWQVRVGPHGIAACTVVGWPIRARWQDIEAVRPGDASGVAYWVLDVRGRWWDLWLPADLAEGERFDTLVAGYLPPGHPLEDWVAPPDGDGRLRPDPADAP